MANYYHHRGGRVHACFLDASKAFDKVKFDKMFAKVIDKGLPAIVVRALVYAYEEQEAWVKLAGKVSTKFRITNGTRQGSVLSPYLFAAGYLDELITRIRKLGLGCHIAGVWLGCCSYADDLALLAPNRDVLQKMVKICEQFGIEHNIVFSTDPEPTKSKTKCVLFSGKTPRVQQPIPIMLDVKILDFYSTKLKLIL